MINEIMNANQTSYNHVLAFEVSKAELLLKVMPGAGKCRISNDRASIRHLIKREIKRNAKLGIGPLLVICEATGSYSRHVLDCAHELGVACHRAHGSRVRWFAKFRGTHAKSDPIDIDVIADYGLCGKNLLLHVPPRPEQTELRDLVGRRTELREMKEAEQARLEHVTSKLVSETIRSHIKSIEKLLAKVEAAIDDLITEDESFARNAELMRSVKGVGAITAATVLAYLPEIGTVSRGTIAALAGLAPFDDDSGTIKGKRHIFGGRAEVRRCLYMAATVAVSHNCHLRALAERMKATGKCHKQAVTAVMRKLLVILNAIIASGEPCRMESAT